MNKDRTLYHICNQSSKVIFRNEEDFRIAICRLAACAYETESEIWAYAFMSTHFHLIIQTSNLEAFVKMFKINVSTWHKNKYNNKIQVRVGSRALNSYMEILTATNYVLKNPVHHKLVDIALSYPYSSTHIYFKTQIYRSDYYEGERQTRATDSPGNLKYRANRVLFASHKVPEKYQISGGKMIVPESFLMVDKVQSLYQSARNFIYQMTKPLTEEIQMFRDDTSSINFQETAVSLFGKLTDSEVCRIIDSYISPRTFPQIDDETKAQLWEILRSKGVNKFQFERAI